MRLRRCGAYGRSTISLHKCPDRPGRCDHLLSINWEFHKQLHRMAHSPLICAKQLVNFEMSDFFIVQTCGFGTRLSQVAQEHEGVIDAILSGDAQRARQAATEHLLSVAANVVRHLREAGDGAQV